MTIQIYDASWVIRKRYEVDASGLAMRNLFDDAYHGKEPQIWVFDGKNAKQARRDVFPGYKIKRKPGSDEFYQTLDAFKELLKYTNKVRVEVPGHEGDDCIAHLVRSSPNTKIHLQANDGDYHVLCNEYVTMSHPALPKISNADARLYKTLVGDGSDDIPGLARFGEGGGVRGGGFLELTEEQKANWSNFFFYNFYDQEAEPLAWYSAETLGLSNALYATFRKDWRLLCAYWRIVGFLPMSEELVAAHTTVGTPNYNAANIILKAMMQ